MPLKHAALLKIPRGRFPKRMKGLVLHIDESEHGLIVFTRQPITERHPVA
jgi:hypothetical protein